MKGILGRKVGMIQLFDEQGNVSPVTVIEAGPCYVTQVKVRETDGYDAIQLGYGEVKRTKLKRPKAGHLGLLKTSDKHPVRRQFPTEVPPVRHLREFRTTDADEYELGSEITVDVFEVGDHVDVVGRAKGRGFAGVMKRHGFGGGPRPMASLIASAHRARLVQHRRPDGCSRECGCPAGWGIIG